MALASGEKRLKIQNKAKQKLPQKSKIKSETPLEAVKAAGGLGEAHCPRIQWRRTPLSPLPARTASVIPGPGEH